MLFTYVHSHTTDTWPAVPLGLVLVVGTTGLQDRFVNTTTSCNHTCNKQNGTQGKKFPQCYFNSSQSTMGCFNLPTTALLAEAMTFFAPEGSLTLDFLVSGL